MSRLLDFLKGIVGLAVVLALLVGVPALLLVLIGFPLPTEMPDLNVVRNHIEDGDVPNEFVVKSLAVVVWIVWIQLAVAVLSEIFAVLRGRNAGRAPVLPALQLFARNLVASMLLLISAFSPNKSAPAAPIAPIDASEIVAIDVMPSESVTAYATGGESLSFAETGSSSDVVAAAGQYETGPSDNWWDMAERLLGDGMRWSELRDLNKGRTMLDGSTITDRTETVDAGWRLDVPTDADSSLLARFQEQPTSSGGDAETDTDRDDENEELSPLLAAIKPYTLVYEGPTDVVDDGPGVPYQVVEGDNLWDIAERHLGDPLRWPEIYERSDQLEQPFGLRITDPNLIWPDAVLWLPSDADNVPRADPELVAEVIGPVSPVDTDDGSTPSLDQGSSEAAPTTPPDSDGDKQRTDDGSEPTEANDNTTTEDGVVDLVGDALTTPQGTAFGVGGLLVAGGLLGLVERARRLRRSQAEERTVPAPPPMELVDLETVLRDRADTHKALSVHSAIQSLLDRPIEPGEPLVAPEVVRMTSDRIEVVQQGPDLDLPAAWRATERVGDGPAAMWSSAVLAAEFFPDEQDLLDDGAPFDTAAPTMVTVGGGLLVNLETIGVLAIEGPAELTAGLIRSMVHELATGPARLSIDLRISELLPGADLHEHVVCGPLDGLANELRPWIEEVELSLTASGAHSAYALRAAGRATTMPGPKVVFANAAEVGRLGPIIAAARRHNLPVAVVLSGEQPATAEPIEVNATIRLDGEVLRLEPYGFTAAMQYLDVDLVLGTEALINHARRAPMVPRSDDQDTILPMVELPTDPAQVPTEETPDGEVLTELPIEEHEITDQADDDAGILIRVLGPVEFQGAPDGLTEPERSMLAFLAIAGPSTAQQVRDAVFPAQSFSDSEWTKQIDRFREQLGPRFSEGTDGRYRVRSVVTDLGSARRWITAARAMAEERAANLMQLALSDVRGAPFSGVDQRHWQWIQDHKMALLTQASAMLIDACFDLCDIAYDVDDLHLAEWACEVGASIDPLHETIVIRRVQLAAALGHAEKAEQVVDEWEVNYRQVVGRPAPLSARGALAEMDQFRQPEVAVPHVG